MNKPLIRSLAVATLMTATQPALAQGTEIFQDESGTRPSPMGTPAPQEKLETHINEQGQVVIEDGRVVKGLPEKDTVPNRNMHRTEQETITADPPHESATPGELE